MPTAKIHVHEHRYNEQRLARLGDAIQGALQAVLKVPPEDYYRIVHALGSRQWVTLQKPEAGSRRTLLEDNPTSG